MNLQSPITHPQSSSSSPTVSIVIPVRDGGANFRRCLEAIVACDPPPHEAIVVDDGSRDDSARVAREWGARVISTGQPASGPAEARNAGARAASGDVILFVDADVALHPDAIGRVTRNFESDLALTACFGSYDDDPAAPDFLSQYKNLFHYYVHQSARADASTFWAGCGAIRREAFLAAGGFSREYGRPAIEDIELGYRLKAAGYTLRLDKTLQGRHLKKWTWRSLLRSDIFDRGVPWTELILRDGALVNDLNLQTHNRASVVIVYLLLIAALLGCAWPSAWVMAGGLAILLLALNLPLYRFFAARRGRRFALRVVPAHWLYYFYNGVSFLIGTGRYFLKRRRLSLAQPGPSESTLVTLSRSPERSEGEAKSLGAGPEMLHSVQHDTLRAWGDFRYSILMIAILLIAAGLRLVNLGQDSFWYDELLQANIAAQDIPTLMAQLGGHAAVPLDYLITHSVLSIGRSEVLLRFPAAFWGILTLPVVYQIGQRLFGRTVGVGAALLLALSGLHASYSQEMRPYALFTFLAALSFTCLIGALQAGRNRYWLGYSLAITAGALTHHFMLFVIVTQGFIVLGVWLIGRLKPSLQRGDPLREGRPYVGFGLAVMPTLGVLSLTPWFGSLLDIGRLFAASIVAPDSLPAGALLANFGGEATRVDWAFIRERLLGNLTNDDPVLSAVLVILLTVGVWSGLRRARWQTALVLMWSIVPAALVIAFLNHRGAFFAIRYILFALPAVLLLVSVGAIETGQAARARRNTQHATRNPTPLRCGDYSTQYAIRITLFALTGASIVLLGLTGYQAGSYLSATRENWREAGRFLTGNVRPDDLVIAPQRADIIYFYVPMPPSQARSSTIPDDLPEHLEHGQRLWLVTSKYIYPPEAYRVWAGLRPSVEYRVDDAVQVWLVTPATGKAELLRAARAIQPPETWQAWATLADQYEVAGDVDVAVEQYRQALHLANSTQQTISLTLRVGDALRRARRFEPAALEYGRALALDPRRVEAWVGLGRVDLEQGRLDEARLQLLQALSIEPQSYAANLFLADVYQRTRQPDKAASHYAIAAVSVPELIAPP